MSRSYGGILVSGCESSLRKSFGSLRVKSRFRLCRFSTNVFGIYPIDICQVSGGELNQIAMQLSMQPGGSLSYFYNSIAGEFICLFVNGHRSREFTDEKDAIYVAINDKGELIREEMQYRHSERPDDLVCDYLRSPLDVALKALAVDCPDSVADQLERAFSEGGIDWLDEVSPTRS